MADLYLLLVFVCGLCFGFVLGVTLVRALQADRGRS